MNKICKPVLTFLFLLVSLLAGAQFKAGYVFGINLSTLKIKADNLNTSPKPTFNIQFGGAMEFRIRRNFVFQPALLLSAKGSDYMIDSVDVSLSPVYLELPLNFVYSIGKEKFSVQFYAGPYFSAGIGGYKIVGGDPLQQMRFSYGNSGDLKPFDIGFNVGAGVNISGFIISARYVEGLANISNSAITGMEMKNRAVAISVSSLFASRK
jgi:hypothetical protein